jgi:hypothetical protein
MLHACEHVAHMLIGTERSVEISLAAMSLQINLHHAPTSRKLREFGDAGEGESRRDLDDRFTIAGEFIVHSQAVNRRESRLCFR